MSVTQRGLHALLYLLIVFILGPSCCEEFGGTDSVVGFGEFAIAASHAVHR